MTYTSVSAIIEKSDAQESEKIQRACADVYDDGRLGRQNA